MPTKKTSHCLSHYFTIEKRGVGGKLKRMIQRDILYGKLLGRICGSLRPLQTEQKTKGVYRRGSV